MDGLMELSLLRLVQSFFGLLGRLSNCCPLSSRFSEKKNWSHVPLILLGCVASDCCVDVIIFTFLHMQRYPK